MFTGVTLCLESGRVSVGQFVGSNSQVDEGRKSYRSLSMYRLLKGVELAAVLMRTALDAEELSLPELTGAPLPLRTVDAVPLTTLVIRGPPTLLLLLLLLLLVFWPPPGSEGPEASFSLERKETLILR